MADFDRFTSEHSILFDLDGTIIDSRIGIIKTLHTVVSALGHVPDEAIDLTWVVGPPLAELMAEVIGYYGDTRVDEAIALYRRFYDTQGRLQTPVFPAMAELIETLARSPIRIFTATSKPASLAQTILAGNGLDRYFDRIHGAADDDTGGEKPEMIARILAQEGLSADHTLMIGDRRFDISGAHANRIRGIGVLWGYGGEKELTEAGADLLVTSPDGLASAIEAQLKALARA
ncbi:HAD-IA family hydrolase [Asaia siamensis]|uniref:Phosphoglycolate phosphatase n=1 Tax=Asaia siamensis TaxID=110479 RepID=A0ABQ1MN92_9PROT|nr:HAD-IA family hydrolase [Asaia siamensis]GBR06659.1 phosphoglycolate phosphatase [Asaia siamensis NRIC 0323]GGC40116.1 phosphoglycolate phosphatase [Asaia siamensis]